MNGSAYFLRLNRGAILLALTAVVCGCGNKTDAPDRFPVTGKVTWNGKPLPEGELSFVAVKGGSTDVATISGGNYLLETTAGAKRVEIRSFQSTADPQIDPATGTSVPDRTQIIPQQYNDQTTLTADVTADSENRVNFDLQDGE